MGSISPWGIDKVSVQRTGKTPEVGCRRLSSVMGWGGGLLSGISERFQFLDGGTH